MNNTEGHKKIINKTKNIVSATILIMSVSDELHNTNLVRERTIETALNLLDNVQRIRTLTSVYKNQFMGEVKNQIDTLLDYLHVGYSVGLISRMNVDILVKELHGLTETIQGSINIASTQNDTAQHIEIPNSFFDDIFTNDVIKTQPQITTSQTQTQPQIHKDNLIKTNNNVPNKAPKSYVSNNDKRQNRKEMILNFITEKRLQGSTDGVMIKDIIGKIKDISEKTLQRELSALVAKGVLKKIGDKRWSRYVIK